MMTRSVKETAENALMTTGDGVTCLRWHILTRTCLITPFGSRNASCPVLRDGMHFCFQMVLHCSQRATGCMAATLEAFDQGHAHVPLVSYVEDLVGGCKIGWLRETYLTANA